jgi:hypothetical protein
MSGSVNFQSGTLDVFGTGGSLTSMSIAGNLVLSGSPTLVLSGNLAPGTYTIASYGGTLNGTFSGLNLPAGDAINYGTGNNSAITLTAVPEPSTLALLVAGAIGLAGYGWRKPRLPHQNCDRMRFLETDCQRRKSR